METIGHSMIAGLGGLFSGWVGFFVGVVFGLAGGFILSNFLKSYG